ncbi:Integrase, catalytic core [Gossypium australe]|uniref:Integrase, catalytic core n=1 Tax=Gossypium australe TaxID=47621 RepID=A0A5B6UJL9_9ROSI|nr:Integrase, catalytic core [Gossypium australe]
MLKTFTEASQHLAEMTINSYMWLIERFTCRPKQLAVRAVGSKDKYQQVLEMINQLEMSLYKAQLLEYTIISDLIQRGKKEHTKVVTFRSGAVVKEPIQSNCGKKEISEKDESTCTPSVGEGEGEREGLENEPTQVETEDRAIQPLPPSVKPIPFPSCLEEEEKKENQEFLQFLNMFKALSVNLLLLELIVKMPKYAKLLRDVMSRRKKIRRGKQIALNEECSMVVSKRVSLKVKDPNSFTIQIKIGEVSLGKSLYDLRDSVKLTPLSIYKRFGLGELKETTVTLQLPDRSLVRPKRVLKDVLVKVIPFIFPVDFIVLDFEDDLDIILLGGIIFSMSRAIIDVRRDELTMDIEGEIGISKCVELDPKSNEVLLSQGYECQVVETTLSC